LTQQIQVPLTVDGHIVFISAKSQDPSAPTGDESEISSRRPSLEQLAGSLGAFATALGEKLQQTGASKVTVEFGCEAAVESGTLVAVVGKASAKSTFKVGMEWTKPTA
jgi:hypothetical protein